MLWTLVGIVLLIAFLPAAIEVIAALWPLVWRLLALAGIALAVLLFSK